MKKWLFSWFWGNCWSYILFVDDISEKIALLITLWEEKSLPQTDIHCWLLEVIVEVLCQVLTRYGMLDLHSEYVGACQNRQ